MGISVKVISTAIEKGFRRIKATVYGETDIRTPRQIAPFGIDSNPVKDMTAIYLDTNKKGKPVILGYFNRQLIADTGELRLYSADEEGEEQIFIHLKNDGTIAVGGEDDNMVRFSKLKEGFDALKVDHNKLVTAFNAHMHPTAPVGPPSPPTPVPSSIPAVASTASVDASKIEEITTL